MDNIVDQYKKKKAVSMETADKLKTTATQKSIEEENRKRRTSEDLGPAKGSVSSIFVNRALCVIGDQLTGSSQKQQSAAKKNAVIAKEAKAALKVAEAAAKKKKKEADKEAAKLEKKITKAKAKLAKARLAVNNAKTDKSRDNAKSRVTIAKGELEDILGEAGAEDLDDDEDDEEDEEENTDDEAFVAPSDEDESGGSGSDSNSDAPDSDTSDDSDADSEVEAELEADKEKEEQEAIDAVAAMEAAEEEAKKKKIKKSSSSSSSKGTATDKFKHAKLKQAPATKVPAGITKARNEAKAMFIEYLSKTREFSNKYDDPNANVNDKQSNDAYFSVYSRVYESLVTKPYKGKALMPVTHAMLSMFVAAAYENTEQAAADLDAMVAKLPYDKKVLEDQGFSALENLNTMLLSFPNKIVVPDCSPGGEATQPTSAMIALFNAVSFTGKEAKLLCNRWNWFKPAYQGYLKMPKDFRAEREGQVRLLAIYAYFQAMTRKNGIPKNLVKSYAEMKVIYTMLDSCMEEYKQNVADAAAKDSALRDSADTAMAMNDDDLLGSDDDLSFMDTSAEAAPEPAPKPAPAPKKRKPEEPESPKKKAKKSKDKKKKKKSKESKKKEEEEEEEVKASPVKKDKKKKKRKRAEMTDEERLAHEAAELLGSQREDEVISNEGGRLAKRVAVATTKAIVAADEMDMVVDKNGKPIDIRVDIEVTEEEAKAAGVKTVDSADTDTAMTVEEIAAAQKAKKEAEEAKKAAKKQRELEAKKQRELDAKKLKESFDVFDKKDKPIPKPPVDDEAEKKKEEEAKAAELAAIADAEAVFAGMDEDEDDEDMTKEASDAITSIPETPPPPKQEEEEEEAKASDSEAAEDESSAAESSDSDNDSDNESSSSDDDDDDSDKENNTNPLLAAAATE